MGLDVYLYRYEDYDATIKLEGEYNRRGKLISDAARDALREELGLDEYGEDAKRKHEIEIDSKKYPEHYFKIGYFRSAYNGSGFNSVVPTMVSDGTLSHVFDVTDDYITKPDWNQAKENAVALLGRLTESIETNGSYRVMDIGGLHKTSVESESDALEVFLGEKRKHTIVALIQGTRFGRSCTYCVYEAALEFYTQALEIVIETIDYVLAQDNVDEYYLHWSG